MSYRERIYRHYLKSLPALYAGLDERQIAGRFPLLRQIIERHFPQNRGASIVDLGCGYGALLYACRQAGYANLLGFDVSPEQVAAAARLGISNVRLGELSEALTQLAPDSIDVIVTFDVLEHFRKDELFPIVDAVYRALRPGGRWVIHVPNAESPFGGRARYDDFTHELAFTRNSIQQLLSAGGFHDVHSYEDTPVVHGIKSAVRWVGWKAIRAVLRLYLAIETGAGSRENLFTQNLLCVAVKRDGDAIQQ